MGFTPNSGSSGRKLLRREGYLPANLTDPNAEGRFATGSGTVMLPEPALTLATSNGNSNYHALQLHFRRRMVSGLDGVASYTWSHSIDNGSWDSGSYLVHADAGPGQDRGSSNFDVRHTVSGGFSYNLFRGWSLHGIARARSGFPIDILVGENAFGLGFDNAPRPDLVIGAPVWIDDAGTPGVRRLNAAAFRPPSGGVTGNLGRNAVRGFGLAQVDAAIERKFKSLRLRLQVYNITNARALGDPVRVLSNPLFGQPVSMASLMFGTGRPISGISPAARGLSKSYFPGRSSAGCI